MASVANGIRQPIASILVPSSVHGAVACCPAACDLGAPAGGSMVPTSNELTLNRMDDIPQKPIVQRCRSYTSNSPDENSTRELTMNAYVRVIDYATKQKPRSS